MKAGTATLLHFDGEARRIVASAGRISTTDGSALEVLAKSDGGEKDLRLIGNCLLYTSRCV